MGDLMQEDGHGGQEPDLQEGESVGSVLRARAPPVHSVTSIYSALSTLAGHPSVTRNTAANQTHKEAALMELTVWRREARTA